MLLTLELEHSDTAACFVIYISDLQLVTIFLASLMHRSAAVSTGGILWHQTRVKGKRRNSNGDISGALYGNDDYSKVAEVLDPGRILL